MFSSAKASSSKQRSTPATKQSQKSTSSNTEEGSLLSCPNCQVVSSPGIPKFRKSIYSTAGYLCNACYWYSEHHGGQPRPEHLISKHRNAKASRIHAGKVNKATKAKQTSPSKQEYTAASLVADDELPSVTDDSMEGEGVGEAVGSLFCMRARFEMEAAAELMLLDDACLIGPHDMNGFDFSTAIGDIPIPPPYVPRRSNGELEGAEAMVQLHGFRYYLDDDFLEC